MAKILDEPGAVTRKKRASPKILIVASQYFGNITFLNKKKLSQTAKEKQHRQESPREKSREVLVLAIENSSHHTISEEKLIYFF
jgi:hypothetical protein